MNDQRNALIRALGVWQHEVRDADRRKNCGMTKIDLMRLMHYGNLAHALGENEALPCPKCYMEKNETVSLSPA